MGGGIFNNNSNPIIRNAIFWGNTAPDDAQISNDSSAPILSYSLVQDGCPAGASCDHITTADPQFVDADASNLRLLLTSPAIDAGNNGFLPLDVKDLDGDGNTTETIPFDRDGGARRWDIPMVADTGAGAAPLVDLGAYETRLIFVNDNASGANNGASWANAFTDLQSALAAAVSSDEIWVAAGTYKPTSGTDKTISFELKDGGEIYGGFAGTETARDQRDWTANLATLSGDIGVAGNTDDNSQHVVYAGWVYHSMLDGFIISGGRAYGTGTQRVGGGMYTEYSELRLANITFSQNSSPADNGGGMYNLGSDITLVNVIFVNNSASFGGGMYNEESYPTLVNVLFRGNSSEFVGGGMVNKESTLLAVNVIFSQNSASSCGGMQQYSDSSAYLYNVTFSQNTAIDHGGGMCNNSSDAAIHNAVFWGNTAPSNSQMETWVGSTVTISHSLIQDGCPANAACDHITTDDPQFVDADAGDLRLKATSPAIDAGDNASLPEDILDLDGDDNTFELLPYDFASQPRTIDHPRADTGSGTAPIVDLGAYETFNTAPVLNILGSPVLTAINEDAYANPGTLVSDILASAAGGDPISDPDPAALDGIAVTLVDNDRGSWQYTDNGGITWNNLGAPSQAAARLLVSNDRTRVRFVPDANYNGTASLDFRAWDRSSGSGGGVADTTTNGGSTSFSTAIETANITVVSINDIPTITDIPNQVTAIDTPTSAITFTIGDVETDEEDLTLQAESSNTTVVPVANIVFGGTRANRWVTITPAAGQSGRSNITIKVFDTGFIPATESFVLTVGAGNSPPSISNILDQTTDEDTATPAIAFTVSDVETPADSLVLDVESSNTTLVPEGNIVLGGSGNDRTVTVTPAANQSGTATITISVSDGTDTSSDSFVLTVNAVNDAPMISDIDDQTTDEDTPTSAIAVAIGDLETVGDSLTLSAESSNPGMVPISNIVFGGSGVNRTVTMTPAANYHGQATITVIVSDGEASSSESFLLTVNPINDAPTLSDVPDQTTDEDTPTGAISFAVGDLETDAGALTLDIESSNTALVPEANIVLGGSDMARTLTITPTANQSGSATITLHVSDGVASDSDSFVLTVNAVNDAPVLAAIGNKTVGVNQPLSFTASATDVEGHTLSFSLDDGAPAGASIDPASGLFTWTPTTTGLFVVTIRVTDSGSPAGEDLETILITVTKGGYMVYLPVVIKP